MDLLSPSELVTAMAESGARKARLSVPDLLIRGALSGAILGFATSLADATTVASGNAVVGAVLFPVGFIMIVLLNLELVTGAFAIMPVAAMAGRASPAQVLRNWVYVYLGNLLGALGYAVLFAAASSQFFTAAPDPVGAKAVAIAVAKTAPYIKAGAAGWLTCFTKAILCNWMVCLGTVMGLISRSTLGKIIAAWMPIMGFFAQGLEHSVVNMFAIPAGILLGAPVSWTDWVFANQIPVTLGNLVGGMVFTGLALYATYRPSPATLAVPQPAE